MKRFSISLVSLLILLAVLPDFGISQPLLKIGSLIPFTGRWKNSGREFAKGMLDASKWVNQRGGISGMKLDLLLMDDTSQPVETVAAFRKLNEADQILLLYVYSTDTALTLLPHIHFNRIPTLVSSVTSRLTDPSKYPYIFSINPTPLDLSKISVKFISEKFGITAKKPKIIFAGSPDQANQYFLDEAKEYARGMGLDIGPDIWTSYQSPSTDMMVKRQSSPLSMMNSYNPDFAYLSLPPEEAFFMLQESKEMGLKTRWICNMKAFDESLAGYEGVFGVQPISPFGEDVPGMVEIKEAHQRWHPYDSHTLSFVEGWATVRVIGEALDRALSEQVYSRERVKLALESFKDFVLGGLIPPLTITDKDHRPSVESRIFIIKDRKLLRYTGFISIGR